MAEVAVIQKPRSPKRGGGGGDRISQLPVPILHSILSLLTLKESCITTPVSKRWSSLFPTLPSLVFDDFSFSDSATRSSFSSDHEVDIDSWLDSVFDILETRQTPISSCTIGSDYFDQYNEDFTNIVRFLCKHGVQRLSLENYGEHYTIPPCIYSCRTPGALEFQRCNVVAPRKFAGLRKLKTLKLEECVVRDEDLERLVSGCRGLERLCLENCYRVQKFRVSGRKLRELEIGVHRGLGVLVEKAPCLESVTVRFKYDGANSLFPNWLDKDSDDLSDICVGEDDDVFHDLFDGSVDGSESEVSRLTKLLEGLAHVQNLSFNFQKRYLEKLRREGVPMPMILPLQCRLHELKKLALLMDPESAYSVSILSCLLNSSPNLEDVVIGDNDWDRYGCSDAVQSDYWEIQKPSECLRNRLNTVTLHLEDGRSKFWIKFIIFLLANARVLKKMVISYSRDKREQSFFEDFQRELLLLQPVSLSAVVELKQAKRGMFYF